MALKIRLARGGSKKRPFYRIVVADSRSPRDGRFIDRLGTYDPRLPKDSEDRVKVNADKAADWIAKGAKPTERVARFLSQVSIEGSDAPVYDWRHGNNPNKGAPGQKAKEREEERAEKAAARKEAEAEAKAAAEAGEAGDAGEGEDAAKTDA